MNSMSMPFSVTIERTYVYDTKDGNDRSLVFLTLIYN